MRERGEIERDFNDKPIYYRHPVREREREKERE